MKTKDELKEIIDNAREFGMAQVEVDGVKYHINPITSTPFCHPVPELKPEDIIKPLSVLDDMDEDEILYWSSPFYDEIQTNKELQLQARKEEDNK